MIEIIGFICAILIGLAMGLMGGGGSILTVPVLVYLLKYSPVMATAYSLFVVGATSLVGAVSFYKRGLVKLKTAFVFGLPSVIMVYTTRKFVIPALPEEILNVGNFVLTKDLMLMLLFAILMVAASYFMIRPSEDGISKKENQGSSKMNYLGILAEGVLVGFLTGLVGAGGGFLIIPALVIFSKLDMKLAVGTSLVIIAAKSLIGFLGDVSNYSIDWWFLFVFTSLSILGMFIGSALSKKIQSEKLKTGFGWFVLVMGVYIIFKELF